MENQRKLNDDQLWDMAGQNQPISKDDIGLEPAESTDGLQSFMEGCEMLHFSVQGKKMDGTDNGV